MFKNWITILQLKAKKPTILFALMTFKAKEYWLSKLLPLLPEKIGNNY